MKIIEEVPAALMHTLCLCQRYQAEEKARHDEKDDHLEEPSVRLFVYFFHNTHTFLQLIRQSQSA